MTLLVADVGGTNTRITLVRDGRLPGDPTRYRNAEFASFMDILAAFGATRDLSGLTGCCIAVAGPVTSGRATLTNRNWAFDVATIAAALPGLRGAPVHLVNDLVALGHALAGLEPRQLLQVRTARAPDRGGGRPNNQALVVGMGTGFNICVVKPTPAGVAVIESELGHASLPMRVANELALELGAGAAQFSTYEHLLSGRGLTRLYRHLSGADEDDAQKILAGYDPARPGALTRTTELFARMLGLVATELVFQYLPYGGIHFAGGVGRGVFDTPPHGLFLGAFDAPGRFGDHIAMVPVRVVTDDAAALSGAARYARLANG